MSIVPQNSDKFKIFLLCFYPNKEFDIANAMCYKRAEIHIINKKIMGNIILFKFKKGRDCNQEVIKNKCGHTYLLHPLTLPFLLICWIWQRCSFIHSTKEPFDYQTEPKTNAWSEDDETDAEKENDDFEKVENNGKWWIDLIISLLLFSLIVLIKKCSYSEDSISSAFPSTPSEYCFPE